MLAVGCLIIVPLLAFMSTGLMATRTVEERMYEIYAADAGFEDAIYNMITPDAPTMQTCKAWQRMVLMVPTP